MDKELNKMKNLKQSIIKNKKLFQIKLKTLNHLQKKYNQKQTSFKENMMKL